MGEWFDPYHKWLGIRPEEQPPDHYRLLGIAPYEDDPEVIENAADQRMRHLRDYQTGPHLDECQKLLGEIVKAKLCLLDADRRREYDAQLSATHPSSLRPQSAATPPAIDEPPPIQHEPSPVRWSSRFIDWVSSPQGILLAGIFFVTVIAGFAVTWLGNGGPHEVETGEHSNGLSNQREYDTSEVETPQAASASEAPSEVKPLGDEHVPGNEQPPADPQPGAEERPQPKPAPIQETDDPGEETTAIDPDSDPASSAQAFVYLRDLETVDTDLPQDVWQEENVFVGRREFLHSIWMRPHQRSEATYQASTRFTLKDADLPKRHLFGAVGIADARRAATEGESPVRFEICGDGDILWRTAALQEQGTVQPFSIDVSGVQVLELSTRSDTAEGAPAVWLGPRYVEHSGKIHLLHLIDPRFARRGEWRMEEHTLVSPAIVHAQLDVPIVLPRAFRLEMDATRQQGESLSLGMAVGANRFNAAIDAAAKGKWFSGLTLVDGQPLSASPYAHTGPVLSDGAAATISVSVTDQEVTLTVDDSQIVQWRQGFERLSPDKGWLTCQPGGLFVGTDQAAVRIRRFDFVPFSGEIDLLQWLDPRRDAVRGDFVLDQGHLVFPSVKSGHLKLPCRVPDDYLLTVTLDNHFPTSVPRIDLVLGDRRAGLILDGYGMKCGLEDVGGRSYHGPEGNATTFAGPALKNDAPTTVVCKIFGQRLQVYAAGELLLDWEGDPRQLPELTGPRYLGLSNWSGGYHVKQLRLRPLQDDVVAEELRAITSQKRFPVPRDELLRSAEAEVESLVERRLKVAKTSQHKAMLARQLLQSVRDSTHHYSQQFVLLRLVGDLSAETGNCRTALDAIDLMAERFEVNPAPRKLAALQESVEKATGADWFGAIALAAVELTEEATELDEYDLALQFARLAMTAAAKSHLSHLRDLADANREEAESLKQAWDDLEEELVTLRTAPRDPGANAAFGKFLCFSKNDWKRGLDHLAAAEEPGLRSVAELEFGDPQDADEQAKLGEAWWSLSRSAASDQQAHFLLRARHWYQRAVDASHGLTELKLEEKIRELDRAALGSERFYLTEMRESMTGFGPWGFGKFGRLGSTKRTDPIIIQGIASPRGLGTHPRANGYSFAQYQLDGDFKTFVTSVALAGTGSAGVVSFYVYGDGKILWQSVPTKKSQHPQSCLVRVRNVRLLELRAHVEGSHTGAEACWLEPFLLKSTPPRGLRLP
jgi:hypothetical protein